MADSDHQHDEAVVLHLVHDSVVTRAHAQQPVLPDQHHGAGWPGIVREQLDGCLDAALGGPVELGQGAGGGRPELDAVGHSPRSVLTCSQGMLSPGSSIAARAAAMSSASSRAATMRSN